jgi:GABA(A) receptor-associated protein
MTFAEENSFDRRRKLSSKILSTYANRIPIIVEPGSRSAPPIGKTKFLAPAEMTVGAFIQEVKKHMSSDSAPTDAIFLFVGRDKIMPSSSSPLQLVYDRHADDDGFLYILYSGESVFG